jgi:hypothetical protein
MFFLIRTTMASAVQMEPRRTGRWHTIPVAVLDHDHQRYLLVPPGETDWVLNLRA